MKLTAKRELQPITQAGKVNFMTTILSCHGRGENELRLGYTVLIIVITFIKLNLCDLIRYKVNISGYNYSFSHQSGYGEFFFNQIKAIRSPLPQTGVVCSPVLSLFSTRANWCFGHSAKRLMYSAVYCPSFLCLFFLERLVWQRKLMVHVKR